MEAAFHEWFFSPPSAVSLIELLETRQGPHESAQQFVEWFCTLKGKCQTVIAETALTDLVVKNMVP